MAISTTMVRPADLSQLNCLIEGHSVFSGKLTSFSSPLSIFSVSFGPECILTGMPGWILAASLISLTKSHPGALAMDSLHEHRLLYTPELNVLSSYS